MHSIILYRSLVAFASVSFFLGCAITDETESTREDRSGSIAQTSFRARSEFAAPVNSDRGWAAALNEDVTIVADQPFRIRFELESELDNDRFQKLRLQYRRNQGAWNDIEAHDFPHPDSEDAATPRASIVSCPAYAHGAATSDLLAGSTHTFQNGAAVSLADRVEARLSAGQHIEFEWALVVRRFADGAATNEQNDVFEFRMVEESGALLGRYRNPSLRLAIPPGHLGGTFVETPGRIGPWQASNGDLYFIMEPTETDNLFMMMKSSDDGRTWREADGSNRPETGDLESVDGRQTGDTIHIIHQVTRSARYHAFRTSDHPTHPDTWAVVDETAGAARSIAQAATLVARSDGSLVAFYVGQGKIHFSVRSPAGEWSEDTLIDADSDLIQAGPQAALGHDDATHLAYYSDDGSIWYRQLLLNGTLTPRTLLASNSGASRAVYGSVLPLCYLPESETVAIIYRQEDGHLWERRISSDGLPSPARRVTDRMVITDAVDSQQPAADAAVDGNAIHLFFVEQSTRSLFRANDRDGWSEAKLEVDGILGSWVRGSIYTRADGKRVYGYVYDAGSDGGSGMNRFGEALLVD